MLLLEDYRYPCHCVNVVAAAILGVCPSYNFCFMHLSILSSLQTIKNDDLEEVRELGSGTYGAVYHGKWKGSDVAIKRIKASCFSGRPSERERLVPTIYLLHY